MHSTHSKLRLVGGLVAAGLLTAGAWIAHADINNTVSAGTIPYHGVLQNAGAPVNGSMDFCFRLFDGSTPVWAEKQTVTVAQGTFAVRLGSVTPLTPAARSKDLSLEVSVVDHAASGSRTCTASGGPSSDYITLGTHQRLGAVAYALQAVRVNHGVEALSNAGYTITDTDGVELVTVTTGGSDQTITLPDPTTNSGRSLRFKKVDAGAGRVLLNGTIDGYSAWTLESQNDFLMVQSDGVAWNALAGQTRIVNGNGTAIRYSTGYCVEYNNVSFGVSGGSGKQTILLPAAFKDNSYAVAAGLHSDTTSDGTWLTGIYANNKATTQFLLSVKDMGTGTETGSYPVAWTAFGSWK